MKIRLSKILRHLLIVFILVFSFFILLHDLNLLNIELYKTRQYVSNDLSKQDKYLNIDNQSPSPYDESAFDVNTYSSHYVNSTLSSHSIFKNGNMGPDENLPMLLFKSSDLYDSNEDLLNIDHLVTGAIPLNVHYFWCGKHWFEFKHYLSVMSVIRFVKPDKIIFHYEHLPVVDNVYYHQWMNDLIHDYPFLVLEQLADNFCSNDRKSQISKIINILNDEGGLYLSFNTWFLRIPTDIRLADFVFALDKYTLDGYILQRASLLVDELQRTNNRTSSIYKLKKSSCIPVYYYDGNQNFPPCVIVKDGNYSTFYPMQIWNLKTEFGKLCRKIFYGTSKIRYPKPSFEQLVPNIAHMIWNGGGEMSFMFYLSVLSLLYVATVDKVFIHGNMELHGQYWKKLITREKGKVEFIVRTQPHNVFQDKIEPWFLSLMSDIVRVDIMIKYGGIYTDTDAIWVKPLTIIDRAYDATANFDWIDWSYPFPDSVNFGISFGKRNAPFWRLFRDSMRTLHNNSPGFTGVQMPYKLLEKYPHLLRIKRRLSVICYQFRCHPNWVDDYHNIAKNHITMNSLPNWREDVNAFHWTFPNPPEFQDIETLLNSTGLFAEIGKNVLIKAGIL